MNDLKNWRHDIQQKNIFELSGNVMYNAVSQRFIQAMCRSVAGTIKGLGS